MASISELLNKISDFKCELDGEEIAFPGILQKENGNVLLNAKLTLEQYRKIETGIDVDVLGEVSGIKAVLTGCHITAPNYAGGNNDVSICAVPNGIIIGGWIPLMSMAKRITVSTSDLNYMFWGMFPFESNAGVSKDNPSVLNYTFPQPIVANDKYGELRIHHKLGLQRAVDFYKHSFVSAVEYSFNESHPLMDAVAKVSVARSLFSFFGNGYISFGDITFEIDDDANEYSLWMNYKENIPVVNEPFFVGASAFGDKFQRIWNAWLDFYELANPITDLFYEIICNRSTRVNAFLNLSQAIEVYSNAFRKTEAKKVAKNDQNNKKKDIKLIHRFQDILTEYNNALELIESNIADYAQGFANMRNYYTHYNSNKYVQPTYDELYSASRILRFVLLVIVYRAVEIPIDHILECKKRKAFSRFSNDAEIILKYSKKK